MKAREKAEKLMDLKKDLYFHSLSKKALYYQCILFHDEGDW
jgi:hypothetical protein